MTSTPDPATSPTRAERLWLSAAILRGALAGTTRAIVTWLLDQHLH